MASNKLPPLRRALAGLANHNLLGLRALGASLRITQITPESFETQLEGFMDAIGGYNRARGENGGAYRTYHTGIDDLTAWLSTVRNVLAGSFGNRWNENWASAGFVQPSTRVPRRLANRIGLAASLVDFFQKNPAYEVASLNVTAARGVTLRAAVLDGQGSVQETGTALRTALRSLGAAERTLRKTMRFLVAILSGSIELNDPRWLAFGLNVPANKTTPAAPTGLRAVVTDDGIYLQCDPTELATRYRFRQRIVGIGGRFTLAKSSKGPRAIVKEMLRGRTIEFIVQAVNGDLQSVASEAILVTLE